MDEPSAFLDPPGVQQPRTIVQLLRSSGVGVLLSSHNLNEMLMSCSRLLLLADGGLQEIEVTESTTLQQLESLFAGQNCR